MVAPGKTMLGFHVLERAVYVQFIYLTMSLSIASKGKQGGNSDMEES